MVATDLEFEEALNRGRQETELVESPLLPAPKLDPARLALANQFPEAAVLEAYKTIEAKLLDLRERLQLPPRTNLLHVIGQLVQRELVRPDIKEIFRNFQRARNASAHVGGDNRVTPGEALEFMELAQILDSVFSEALKKMEKLDFLCRLWRTPAFRARAQFWAS